MTLDKHLWTLLLLAVLYPMSAPRMVRAADEPTSFTRQTPGGFELTISSSGLNRVTLGDRTVAEGQWTLIEEEAGDLDRATVETLKDDGLRVQRTREHATTTFTYRINGEDLTITAYVENHHPEKTLSIPSFGSLTFRFRGTPPTNQPTKHSQWGWLNRARPRSDRGHMHPGWGNRMGGSYASDAEYGIGATPLNRTFSRTHLKWDGGPDSNERNLAYHIEKPIPPGAARTIRIGLRLSRKRNWRHLLQPYKDHFTDLYGGQHYETDHRFVAMTVISAGVWRSPSNPYGFAHHKRIHKAKHARDFAQRMSQRIRAANGQGEIIWANTGWDQRGCMFRTDFDVMPPEVQSNWSILTGAFRNRGRKLGVCVRPAQLTYRVHWYGDNYTWRDGTDPAQTDKIWERIENMMDRGCTIFYLDVFGHKYDHIPLARELRERMGPEIMTYAEHPTDASLAYHGAYMSIKWNPKRGYYLFWGLEDVWEVCRWLLDDPVGVGAIHHSIYRQKEKPEIRPQRWAYENGLSPLVMDHNFNDMSPDELRSMQAEYLTENGQWK